MAIMYELMKSAGGWEGMRRCQLQQLSNRCMLLATTVSERHHAMLLILLHVTLGLSTSRLSLSPSLTACPSWNCYTPRPDDEPHPLDKSWCIHTEYQQHNTAIVRITGTALSLDMHSIASGGILSPAPHLEWEFFPLELKLTQVTSTSPLDAPAHIHTRAVTD